MQTRYEITDHAGATILATNSINDVAGFLGIKVSSVLYKLRKENAYSLGRGARKITVAARCDSV